MSLEPSADGDDVASVIALARNGDGYAAARVIEHLRGETSGRTPTRDQHFA